MELFEKLNHSLTASWSLMYHYAQAYAQENGDLDVPKRYVTKEGYSLGAWLYTQRQVYSGKIAGTLTNSQIELLNAIGMVWDVPDYLWEQNYSAAVRYHRAYGHLNVPADYVDEEGIRLGAWLNSVRSSKKGQNRRAELTAEQTARLDVWA